MRSSVDVLAWELTEARSKSAWRRWRFAEKGDETSELQRAPAAIDWPVYLGGPPIEVR